MYYFVQILWSGYKSDYTHKKNIMQEVSMPCDHRSGTRPQCWTCREVCERRCSSNTRTVTHIDEAGQVNADVTRTWGGGDLIHWWCQRLVVSGGCAYVVTRSPGRWPHSQETRREGKVNAGVGCNGVDRAASMTRKKNSSARLVLEVGSGRSRSVGSPDSWYHLERQMGNTTLWEGGG